MPMSVKILKDIGIDYALAYLRKFDMGTTFPRDLSLGLGSGVVIPYNFIRAFGTFASYGRTFDPFLIQTITDPGVGTLFQATLMNTPAPAALGATANSTGIILPDDPNVQAQENGAQQPGTVELPADLPERTRIISEQTAYIITNILCEAVQGGTGYKAKALGRPVAGKTGTSDANRDAWFVGYTPDVLCGVWVGYDDNMESLGRTDTGGTAATPIFTEFMRTAVSGKPARDFRVPDGIVFTKIDTTTGKPATETSTSVKFEIYKGDSSQGQQQQQPQEQQQGPSEDQLLKEIY
jgi:penicillin-binding protein 1A